MKQHTENTVLVTGANGFVGQALCREMLRQGWQVSAAVRAPCQLPVAVATVPVGAIDGETNWADALREVDVVIHLAARVHVMEDMAADPLAEFLKVNGEQTSEGQPFVESGQPDPQDPYAVSKWQAEQALHGIAQETGLEVVIVRPPLVYGPGVKGNFIKLLAAVDKGVPMPLAGVRNKRSLIYLDNLVGALIACASHPAAAGKTYLVRDGEDVSMPELVRQIAAGLGKSARLFPLPAGLLRGMGGLFGKLESVERITSSLRVNDDLIRRELGWKPAFTLQQGLQATAGWYKAHAIP